MVKKTTKSPWIACVRSFLLVFTVIGSSKKIKGLAYISAVNSRNKTSLSVILIIFELLEVKNEIFKEGIAMSLHTVESE